MSTTTAVPKPFYDLKSPAAHGHWTVIVRTASGVFYHRFHTEAEANQHLGLPGGSTDSSYVPPEARA
jgi:hypothetical protein